MEGNPVLQGPVFCLKAFLWHRPRIPQYRMEYAMTEQAEGVHQVYSIAERRGRGIHGGGFLQANRLGSYVQFILATTLL